LPVKPHCHVWVWTTHMFMPLAFSLLEQWSLRYVCTFVWHKKGGFQPLNRPQYNCEFALYATYGCPRFTITKAFKTGFKAPRGGHSVKPDFFYATVRRVTEGRRLDLFARRTISESISCAASRREGNDRSGSNSSSFAHRMPQCVTIS
ncbi:MAG TPA: MT-A70 family methyltransferase, partial [Gammaproteobacteria bacterium]|nr:MT-A70 family methyltransferase [Gammaproteobacteria bacterium]